MRGRVNMAQAILKGEADVDETFLEHLAQCSLCGSCGEHCPVGMPLLEIWSALRADLVDAGLVTENQRVVRDNTVEHHSIFGPGRRPAGDAKAPHKVDVLYFPGCQTSRKIKPIGRSTTELLDKLGVNSRGVGRGRMLWLPTVRYRADGCHAAGGRIHAGEDTSL